MINTEDEIDGKQKYSQNNTVEVSFNEYKFTDNQNNKWFLDRIKKHIEESLKINLIELNEDFHVLIYKVGDAFPKHIDYFSNSDNPRIYTFGLLLNDDFEGGEFVIYTESTKTLNKTIGNSYLFDTTIPHEVKKISKGDRISLIIHIRNNEIKKRNLF